jgi:hypothetical protein
MIRSVAKVLAVVLLLAPRLAAAQTVEEARARMLLHLSDEAPPPVDPLVLRDRAIQSAESLRNGGIVVTILAAATTAFGVGWIAYEATHPPNCHTGPGDVHQPFDFSPAFCEIFAGFRYGGPILVTVIGAEMGAGGAVLWAVGAKRLRRAQISVGPGSVKLAWRW